MVSARAVVENILALILVIICTIIWVAHSQYFYMKYADMKTSSAERYDSATSLALPNLVLCSRSPVKNNLQYSSNAPFVQYAEEEINPSLSNLPGRIPLMANSTLGQGEQAFMNLYPNNNVATGKWNVLSMLYSCTDVILDCTWNGITTVGSACCNMVNTIVPTMDGICWSITGNTSYIGNTTLMQTTAGFRNGLLIRLQINPTNYQRTGQTQHPGFDLYLSDQSLDMWRMINEMENPIYISSTEGVRINMEKTITTNLDNLMCGFNPDKAAEVDQNALMDPSKTPFAACILDYAISKCGCHPLFSEFLNIDQTRNAAFNRLWGRINNNSSRPCTTTVMINCVQLYMSYLMPENYQQEPIGNSELTMDVKECMRNWHKPCQSITYTATSQYYSLTSTSNFQAEFTVSYTQLMVKQIIENYDMNIIDLASYIGFAGALWFSIGHILWSVARVFKSMCCKREENMIEPKKERAPLTPYISPPAPEIYQTNTQPAEIYQTHAQPEEIVQTNEQTGD